MKLLSSTVLPAIALASDITTFTDEKCTRSWRALDAVNGYPDGLCKPLNVTKGQSFQVQKLDPGCAVTLYGENEGPLSCSSASKVVGHLATCYDQSWMYYSIDGCLPPAPSSIKFSSVTPSSTASSATHSATANPESKVHTGVIIGSAVAVTLCVILAVTGVLLNLRRRKKISPKQAHELSEDRAVAESDAAAEKQHPKELWGDHAAVEIGRNSRFEDSLSGRRTTLDRQEVRGVNPMIRIHYV